MIVDSQPHLRRLRVGGALWVAIAAVGCNALFGVDDLSYDDTSSQGGGGGAASTTSTTTTTTAGAGGGGGQSTAGGAGGVGGAGGTSTGGAGGSGGAMAICDDHFGALNAYTFCDEDDATCKFLRQIIPSESCNTTCSQGGMECDEAHDQGDGPCVEAIDIGCGADTLNDIICICRKSCGTGPPCQPGEQCTSGACN